ncbi:hypothetical protein FJZ18_04230 [Candidatus Pacearchaeota archaeon]|nr:hypothetical protein [Candidatus Pacearchaeota archaeon]
MKDEIIAGIKNGLERGESLDQAMQTFINAGYKSVEIREAANSLTGGTTPIVTGAQNTVSASSPSELIPQTTSAGQPQTAPANQTNASPANIPSIPSLSKKSAGKDTKKIVLLVVLLLFLIGILIAAILFKDTILKAFSS